MQANKGNGVQDFVLPSLVLTAICAVMAAAMVITYQMTKPIIDFNTKAAADAARAEVYTGVSGFEPLTVDGFESCSEAYRTSGGEGYVFTTSAKGFDGPIQVMTAISAEGKVVGIKVLEHTETPGLGSRATEDAYLSQYIGKDSQLSGIQYIAGVTYSSRGVNNAVAAAFQVFEAVSR